MPSGFFQSFERSQSDISTVLEVIVFLSICVSQLYCYSLLVTRPKATNYFFVRRLELGTALGDRLKISQGSSGEIMPDRKRLCIKPTIHKKHGLKIEYAPSPVT